MDDYAVLDPKNGEVVETYASATDAEVTAAVRTAADASASWAALPVVERARIIRRVSELHSARAEKLAQIIQREMGKPHADGVGEVEFSAAIYAYYADNAERFMADRPIELLNGTGSAVIRPSAVGTIFGIMPWNYPYYQVARFAGPNLVAGNTVLLKHAPQCPESASAIQEIYVEAGVPDGVYTTVFARIDQVEGIVASPSVRGVSLTGSERAGAAVAELAGRHLKKVVLELGGSDPFIILGTDDLDATVDAAVLGRLENTGQACNAAKRFIVAEELYEAFVERFTDKLIAGYSGAPLSSPRAASNLANQVDVAVRHGAELRSSGERRGCFFPAGVLTNVASDNPVYSQELFGPVAVVHKARDEADAVRIANDTPYGLGSYVFATNPEQALRVANQLDTGMVFINGVNADGAELPFGGTKRSGFGRELGTLGFEEFVNKKLIRVIA